MRDIPLNDFTIDLLNEALWFSKEENYSAVVPSKMGEIERGDYFTGDEYFEQVKSQNEGHDGFPEIVVGWSFNNEIRYDKHNPVISRKIAEVSDRHSKFLTNIQTTFNLKKNALFTLYPPGGYISWHNNANASAYNFIFTYSETGDGWWKHWDPVAQKMVHIPDVKGWQCKAGHFGAYADGSDKLVYHAARNGKSGKRMTVAFVLDRSEMSLGLQDWIIEDIHA
jgi:hypothetical protein